jgi:ribosomal protein L6P/L9E
MKKCTTHHKACDCREAATKALVSEMINGLEHGYFYRLRAKAVRLGYVQGRKAKPAAQGEGEG